ncbi:uncharacterized protein LOC135164309 [Diachasmimorpha longicaudata]|uniref:uncharacterized protein LOC135164309 n=1 Tax=Diachasmimorpha longicaudata TaxID=58733 RepID=UPI0030B8C70E
MQDKMSTRALLFVILMVIFQIEASNAISNIADLNTAIVQSLDHLKRTVKSIKVRLYWSQPADIAQLGRRLEVVKNYYDTQISLGRCSAKRTERCFTSANRMLERWEKTYTIKVNECYDRGARRYKNFTDHFMSHHLKKQKDLKMQIKIMDADCSATNKRVHECIEFWNFDTQLAKWKAEISTQQQNNIDGANQQLKLINSCVRSSFEEMNAAIEYYQSQVMTCAKCSRRNTL